MLAGADEERRKAAVEEAENVEMPVKSENPHAITNGSVPETPASRPASTTFEMTTAGWASATATASSTTLANPSPFASSQRRPLQMVSPAKDVLDRFGEVPPSSPLTT